MTGDMVDSSTKNYTSGKYQLAPLSALNYEKGALSPYTHHVRLPLRG
jgi:hypothetical protein